MNIAHTTGPPNFAHEIDSKDKNGFRIRTFEVDINHSSRLQLNRTTQYRTCLCTAIRAYKRPEINNVASHRHKA